jgi:uncharacterized protein with von Willebrand factor type A (vWA) domain
VEKHVARALGGQGIGGLAAADHDAVRVPVFAHPAIGGLLYFLNRSARGLVWLNPLLGWKDYAPVARAMAAALDHIDCFATAHSLASLAALEDEFVRL